MAKLVENCQNWHKIIKNDRKQSKYDNKQTNTLIREFQIVF